MSVESETGLESETFLPVSSIHDGDSKFRFDLQNDVNATARTTQFLCSPLARHLETLGHMPRIAPLVLLAFGIPAIAEGQATLRERLLDLPIGEDLSITITGCPPLLDLPGLLNVSDLVVRAVVQSASAGISDDERFIETAYDLRVEEVIFTRMPASSVMTQAMSNVTLRHVGGTLIVDGRTVRTLDNTMGARFQIGTRLILFLAKDSRRPGIYRLVDGPYGTFSIREGKVGSFGVPQRYDGLDAENFAALIRASIPR